MIVKTVTGIYDVREDEKRFRRLGDPAQAAWHHFDHMGPVRVDEPMRFFTLKDAQGSSASMGVWTTTPVEAVVPDDSPQIRGRHRRLAS